MKILRLHIYFVILLITLVSCNETNTRNYIQYVNPLIGTASASTILEKEIKGEDIGGGLTIPAVSAPFGMTQWTPQIQSTEKKCLSPFYFGRIRFQGFRGSHWLNGSCSKDYGSFTIFPTDIKNNFRFLPDQREAMYMYNTDIATPAYLSVFMPEQNIITEITATKRCGFFKFSWMDPKHPTLIIDVNNEYSEGYIKIDKENQEIYGYNPAHHINKVDNKPAGVSGYFVIKFNKEFIKTGTYSGMDFVHNSNERKNEDKIGAYVTFDLSDRAIVKAKVGTSFTSIENARKNLDKEIKNWNFEETRINLEKTWNNLMGKIDVEGGAEEDNIKFYTAMYHSLLHPRLYSDVNGEYPGFANNSTIQKTDGFEYYDDFLNWNIYRAQMPLLSILAPKEYNDMIKSLIVKAEQGGWLPTSTIQNSYNSITIGDHGSSIITDAAMKGFKFDIEKAYKYMRKNAFETPMKIEDYKRGKGRRSLVSYLQLGYIPLEDENYNTFHKEDQVLQTLEFAYNDWAVAQVAKKLDKTDDYNELIARSYNYSNVYNEETGWVCSKFADGSFVEEAQRQYTFYVPHDLEGLMDLMGGNEFFYNKLNLKVEDEEYLFRNEPSQHISYLFNYVDDWEKTQTIVKNILSTEYSINPGGLPGNDNGGQLSAWYVFSAVGFYPVCPGSNEYQLSSPIFEKVTLSLDKEYYPGGKFTFETAPGNNFKIFNTVKLNGDLIDTKITHEDLQKGGSLIFSNEEDK